MDGLEVSREEEIRNATYTRPHVFILGAGASIAASPTDRNGKALPDMPSLAKLPAIAKLLNSAGFPDPGKDFESVYAEIRGDARQAALADAIDEEVRAYFNDVEIPDEPTIYDYLVLSLREKDLVATFNWDPLLLQAYVRVGQLGAARLPHLAFLHGNVAVGACRQDKVLSHAGGICSRCGQPYENVPLLYPVSEKNYEADEIIAAEWSKLRWGLKNASLVTIFGYSAPVSDVTAIAEFKNAWGTWEDRQFEQFEIIGRPGADPDRKRRTWDDFIHTHHYDVWGDFFDSWVAHHPRRSGEAYWSQYIEARFIEDNPVPRGLNLQETVAWYRDLMGYE
jgi:hypothetical protein